MTNQNIQSLEGPHNCDKDVGRLRQSREDHSEYGLDSNRKHDRGGGGNCHHYLLFVKVLISRSLYLKRDTQK